ncbi:MAG TPA: ankyrin repeat domain-containing protein [Pyrinomonadaceae bacterium]|jgi:hypothetical protein
MTRAFPPERQQKADARALFDAAEAGDAAAVARLLAAGAPADARLAHGGETPLMRAAARGHEGVACVLLDAGADVSAQRADGFSPLILAVFFGHYAVVRLLVERGADAGARTGLGTTAARWAASRGFGEMADLLRSAEAAAPRAAAPSAAATETTQPSADSAAAETSRAATSASDEVSIFSRKAERRDARGVVTRASALADGVSDRTLSIVLPSGVSLTSKPLADEDLSDLARPNSAAGVSVRLGGNVPAHPSAATFRLGHFLRSWQGSVGAAMLLLALGVAVFTLMRGGTNARDAAPPVPQPSAPQAAAQVTPPPAAQPTPAFPTPDPSGAMPVTDPAYALPNTAGQPFYVPQTAPGPVPSDVPRELTVVSESGATSNENAARPARKTEPNANDAAPARPETRGDANAEADARPARPARTPEPEPQRPAPPPVQSNQPPPPAPQPTPGRAKVIPWPPQ